MVRNKTYKTIFYLFTLFFKQKQRESYPLLITGIIFFVVTIASSTFLAVMFFQQNISNANYLLDVFSKMYLLYFAAGFVARISFQSLPYYYVNYYKVLNISKLHIAITIGLLSFFNSNNYFSCLIIALTSWVIYSIKSGVVAVNFLTLNFLFMILLNIVVASIKITIPAIFYYIIAGVLIFVFYSNYPIILNNSSKIFFELIEKPSYLLLLTILILSLIALTGYIKLIAWRLYSE